MQMSEKNINTNTRSRTMDEAFFEEYTSQKAVLMYTWATAGYGINYLLDHDYKEIYLRALESLPAEVKKRGIRILEFGCAVGMNLVHLVSVLHQKGIKVEKAVGTDFSPVLIDVAKRESKKHLPAECQGKIEFHIANNESLVADLSAASGTGRANVACSFDFILGVNTIRYCHRSNREMSCASDIMEMLVPGGVCVVIDMNNRFPAFSSGLKNRFRRHKKEECYIPALDEYAAPFERAGFEVLRKEQFCWIPHSSRKLTCAILRALSPALNKVAKSRAMRSLVVIRKPATGSPV